ncbi:SH3 domain-containing protein [Mesobacillus subterraneus]|uniref:SH3 domain-containing protein n=1 Tax=Mesobacillus subterraneus TaxID=285983 RepID=UPI00273F3E49|nr:SH3 domain-containing protein [Mesobacillus subterraneus]WLR55531.1 SH3 domain-containing protein [Mesobacillus subterraneus]
MKKIIASSVLSTALLFPSLSWSEELKLPANMVVEQKVEVRKGATTSYPIVEYIDPGQKVPVIGQFTNTSGEIWYRVDLGDVLGWSPASKFAEPNVTGSIGIVNGDNVNVRRRADISYASIAKISTGRQVKIIDSFINSSGEIWYRIEFDGNVGWILSSLVDVQSTTTAPAPSYSTKTIQVDKSAVRKGADDSYSVVTYVNSGQSVKVIGAFTNSKGEKWSRLDLGNNVLGWVNDTAFVKAAFTAITKTIQVDKSEVRKGADGSYSVVTYVNSGQSVKVIDAFTNSKGEKWSRLNLGNNVFGWVNDRAFVKPAFTAITKTIQVDKSAVRKGADDSYSVVTYVNSGQSVKVIDAFTNSKGEKWSRLDLGNNVFGWVNDRAFVKPAFTAITKTIQVDKSAVRKGADDSYSVVTYVNSGQPVKVIDAFTNSKGEKWSRLDLGNNVFGWVSDIAFVKQTVGLPAIGTTVYGKADSVTVRRGASTSYTGVATLKLNQAAKIVAHYTGTDGVSWLRLELSPNLLGWVPASSVMTSKAVITTQYVGTKNAVLRSGASYSYKVTENLPYFSKVTVLDQFTGTSGDLWYRIKAANGNVGWVPGYELVVSKSDYTLRYALNNAPLRRGASTSYSAIATLPENEALIVLRSLGDWLNVETQAGVRGWIYESQTSATSMKRLIEPTAPIINGDQYLMWKKPANFKPSYQVLSFDRIKINGGLTDITLPPFAVKGIKSVEIIQSSTFEKSAIITFEPGYTYTLRNDSDKLSIKVITTGLKGKKIVVDAGHGGKDSGAIGPSGLMEKTVNLGTALLLKQELEKYGAIVRLTRSTDVFLELYERTDIANTSDYDAFISIHADSYSSTSRGSSTFYNTSVNFNGPQSAEMAKSIQTNMVAALSTYNRGVYNQGLFVNRMNELPSILVELAFMSNPTEEKLLATDAFRQKAAVGIRNGLEEYFGN